MRTIKYNSFEEAFAAMFEFINKGIGLTTLVVWED